MKFSRIVTKVGSAARAADVVLYSTLERVTGELHAVLFRKRLSPRSRARPAHLIRGIAPGRRAADSES